MRELDNLSNTELQKKINELNGELQRRKAVEIATRKISKILSAYGLEYTEVQISKRKPSRTKNGTKSNRPTQIAKKRSEVRPKYHDGTGKNYWTGRGRAPKWVNAICETQNITIEEFKSSENFLLIND